VNYRFWIMNFEREIASLYLRSLAMTKRKSHKDASWSLRGAPATNQSHL